MRERMTKLIDPKIFHELLDFAAEIDELYTSDCRVLIADCLNAKGQARERYGHYFQRIITSLLNRSVWIQMLEEMELNT